MEETTTVAEVFVVRPKKVYTYLNIAIAIIFTALLIFEISNHNTLLAVLSGLVVISSIHDTLSYALNKIVVNSDKITVKRFLKKDKVIMCNDLDYMHENNNSFVLFNKAGDRVLTISKSFINSAFIGNKFAHLLREETEEVTEESNETTSE